MANDGRGRRVPKSALVGRTGAAGAVRPRVPGGGAPLRVVEPPAPSLGRYSGSYFGELWRHRAAFIYFVRRFMRKRYARTFFGYLWFFIPVLLPLFVGALVFGGILGVGVPGIPYFLYFAVATSAWTVFSRTAYFSTRSIEISRSDLRRVYVPRLIPLTAAMTIPVITFLVFVLIIAGTLGFYVVERGELYLELRPATLLAPLGLTMLILFGLACGLWFSPLAARARDVRRLANYVLNMWYFLTPVLYPITQIPESSRWVASLNPATAPLELVKEGVLGVGEVTTLGLATYFGALVVIGGVGLPRFIAKERKDIVHY